MLKSTKLLLSKTIIIHFLKKVAKTKKPMIISTGMLSLKELKNIVNYVKKMAVKKLILLKCTSAYPADPKDANLLTMKEMRKIFKCEVDLLITQLEWVLQLQL